MREDASPCALGTLLTVVFRYADFSRQWTRVEKGTVVYRP